MPGSVSILSCIQLDLKYNVETIIICIKFISLCISFHAGRDFNDTVIMTEIPVGQTQLVQAIKIFDDQINEGQEYFSVSLEVVGNISNAVQYRIQTTQCRIPQSDRKLSCKTCMHFMYTSLD